MGYSVCSCCYFKKCEHVYFVGAAAAADIVVGIEANEVTKQNYCEKHFVVVGERETFSIW